MPESVPSLKHIMWLRVGFCRQNNSVLDHSKFPAWISAARNILTLNKDEVCSTLPPTHWQICLGLFSVQVKLVPVLSEWFCTKLVHGRVALILFEWSTLMASLSFVQTIPLTFCLLDVGELCLGLHHHRRCQGGWRVHHKRSCDLIGPHFCVWLCSVFPFFPRPRRCSGKSSLIVQALCISTQCILHLHSVHVSCIDLLTFGRAP